MYIIVAATTTVQIECYKSISVTSFNCSGQLAVVKVPSRARASISRIYMILQKNI